MKKYIYRSILVLLVLGIAVTTHASTTVLRPGLFNNKEVMILQKKLGVIPTGNYLTQTTAAVKKLQQVNNLPVTGVVDSSTQKVIDLIDVNTTTPSLLPKITPDVPKLSTDLTTSTEVNKWATLCMDGKPHVQVLSPNGGESYVAGQQVNVKWRSCNVPVGSQVTLSVFNVSINNDFYVTNLMTNDGQEIVTLPNTPQYNYTNFNYGLDSKIRIWLIDPSLGGNGGLTSDLSDNLFIINAPGTLTTQKTNQVLKNGTAPIAQVENKKRQACTNTSAPFIEVLSPGGNTYYHGDIMNIKVRTCNVPYNFNPSTNVNPYPYDIYLVDSLNNNLTVGIGNYIPAHPAFLTGYPTSPEGYFEIGFKVPSSTGTNIPNINTLHVLNGVNAYKIQASNMLTGSNIVITQSQPFSILPPPNPTATVNAGAILNSAL